MKGTSRILALDIVLIALMALGVYRVSEKATVPAPYAAEKVTAIDGVTVHSADEREFLLDERSIGEPVRIVLDRNGTLTSVSTLLVRDYSLSKILIECVAALIFFGTGIIVLRLQPRDPAARLFHYLALAIGALILLTSGRFTIEPMGLGYVLELLFQFAYLLVPVLFIHFTLIFPRDRFSSKRTILLTVYALAACIGLWRAIAFLRAAYPSFQLDGYGMYDMATYATLLFFAIGFLVGFGVLLHSFVSARESFERRKLRWIFFGIVVGTGAYIALEVIPQLLGRTGPDEQYAILLSVIAPVSFAIAIIRFKVFDIDLFFKRSTAYSLALLLLFGSYLGLVLLLTPVVSALKLPAAVTNGTGAIIIALLFDPIRRTIQTVIDKKFFRVSYNFHQAQRGIVEQLKFPRTETVLAEFVTGEINRLIPVTKIGLFLVEATSDRLKLLAHSNFDILEKRKISLQKQDLKTSLELPIAMPNAIESEMSFEPAEEEVFRRWGMALVLPMLAANKSVLGFLVLGEKRSGARFLLEDVSLLTSVAAQTALALERIRVERELVIEQAESERLAELSAMKSFFVSSVSHDLKTPLTSIRLFAELIKDREDMPREKALEYLTIIEGESDRLARLIANVLDFAKIEKGTKEYVRKPQDLNRITSDVIRAMEYQIVSHGFEVQTSIAPQSLAIEADYDAVFDAATNLISNAMKYSPSERKKIAIGTSSQDGFAVLSICDCGYGMSPAEIERIFDPFYRIDHPETKSTAGAGIGLAIVKHTMQAHGGTINVESEPGNGSNFALYFPLTET